MIGEERAIIGELIAKFILLYRGAVAVIVKGLVRDGAALRRYRYAVWSEGFSPLGCFNAKNGDFPIELEKKYEPNMKAVLLFVMTVE
jgi:regulator of RNase E activity RraA